jgi:hypothetical protein
MNPDALGKPGQGIHTHVGGIAIFDTVATIGGGYLIAKRMEWDPAKTILGLFVFGEIVHWYVGVETTVTKSLGLRRSRGTR